MVRTVLRRAALALAATLLACGGTPPAPISGRLQQSSKPRLSAASVPAADVRAQAHDNAAFAFDLYAQVRDQPGNLFISPYSISSALAMVSAGARGASLAAMDGALHFQLPAPRLHAAFNALDAALASRAQVGTSATGGPFTLSVANALWVQDGLGLQQDFLDTLAQNYGAGVHLEDFLRASEPARAEINAWVEQQTAGKIPELLRAGDVDANTRLVLSNAIFFSGAWATPFDPQQTHAGDFHALDGSTAQVPLMHLAHSLGYARGQGFAAVELPYSNRDLSLMVLVPDPGQLANVEAQLTVGLLDQTTAALAPQQVLLDLPRFSATTHAKLRPALTRLGMGPVFDDGADFSGIDGLHDLHVADVVHEATVQVDEAGTEAAAATAVVMAGNAASTPVSLTVDRPFLLVLRDLPTGSVLFLGRVVAP